jgi:hypothetical protein
VAYFCVMGARLDFVPSLDSLGDGKKMKREIYIIYIYIFIYVDDRDSGGGR